MTSRLSILIAMLCALFIAAPAYGQGSDRDGYGGDSESLGEIGTVEEDAPTQTPSTQEQPATGGDDSPAPTGDDDAAPSSAPAGAEAQQEVSGSSLPFTGADIGLMAMGGILMVALGFGLRRLATTRV